MLKKYTLIIQLLVLWTTLALPHISSAKQMGTESGGGGGVVWAELNYPILMDYFTIYSSALDIPTYKATPSRLDQNSSYSFYLTRENEQKILSENPAFSKAISILDGWSNLPYDAISFTVRASFYFKLNWRFVEHELTAPAFYKASPIKELKTEVAAYYSFDSEKKSAIVRISKNIWNQMELQHQAGLLIHESLRQVQIALVRGYDDESLQRATAIYITCKPSGRLNYYMTYLLNNSPVMADKIYGSFEKILKQSCEKI